MGALIRIIQSLPLIIALCVIAAIIYVVVSWRRSPTRAKEILIKVFLVLTSILSAFFLLATLYAVLEQNWNVMELFAAFLAVSVIALVITLICRWRFRKNHPHYQYTPQRARTHFRWETKLRTILDLLKNGPFSPRS